MGFKAREKEEVDNCDMQKSAEYFFAELITKLFHLDGRVGKGFFKPFSVSLLVRIYPILLLNFGSVWRKIGLHSFSASTIRKITE